MKEFWVEVRPWNKELATAAIESGAGTLLVDRAAQVRELGRIRTIAPDGDCVPDKDIFEITIQGKSGEERALELSKQGYVIVRTADWTVIPLENLVSQSDRIIAAVENAAEAELALSVLERGTAGILLKTDSPAEIKRVAALIASGTGTMALVPFTVTAIRQVGMGDRVCVDTCSLLSDGQGMLVGNASSAFLLVHPETLENPYVAPRPFRVNAGAVHAYIMRPDKKTAYLSEVRVGDHVLVVDAAGKTTEAVVGRVKIERRPLLLVEATAGAEKMSLILQNAETIRLVGENGEAISVVDLKPGDVVLGYTTEGGRHFGVAVKEAIIEK